MQIHSTTYSCLRKPRAYLPSEILIVVWAHKPSSNYSYCLVVRTYKPHLALYRNTGPRTKERLMSLSKLSPWFYSIALVGAFVGILNAIAHHSNRRWETKLLYWASSHSHDYTKTYLRVAARIDADKSNWLDYTFLHCPLLPLPMHTTLQPQWVMSTWQCIRTPLTAARAQQVSPPTFLWTRLGRLLPLPQW